MERHELMNKTLLPLDAVLGYSLEALKKANVYEPVRNGIRDTLLTAIRANFKLQHKVKVYGEENVPTEGGVILAINHQSWLDAQVVSAMSPRYVSFIAKAMFKEWPMLRHLIEMAGGVYITRGGDDGGLESVAQSLRDGACVGIFPEGTIAGEEDISRHELDPETGLLRGKTGAVRLALMADVPIVPVGLSGPGRAFPPEAYPRMETLPLPKPEPIEVRFGKPLHFKLKGNQKMSYKRIRDMTDQVMHSISSLVDHSMAYEPLTLPIQKKDVPTKLPPIPYKNKRLDKKAPYGVLMLHGFTSHVSCVSDLRFPVEEMGLPYRVPVLRGHGTRWEDLKGVKAEDWYEDANNAMLDLLQECEKVIVVGLSMGGLVALDLAVRHRDKVASVVTVAAALKFKDPLSALTPIMAKAIPSWPSPKAYHDKALEKQRNRNYPKFPTQAFNELYNYAARMENKLSFVHADALILHSHKDQVVHPKAAKKIEGKIASKNKRMVWFEESGHEMLLDMEAPKVTETITGYLKEVTRRPVTKK